jgi:hypothetical protein
MRSVHWNLSLLLHDKFSLHNSLTTIRIFDYGRNHTGNEEKYSLLRILYYITEHFNIYNSKILCKIAPVLN